MANRMFGLDVVCEMSRRHVPNVDGLVPATSPATGFSPRPDVTRALAMGNLPIERAVETRHILLAGDPRTGRLQAIHQQLDAIRGRGEMAIVCDTAGAFVPGHYRPELGDRILNPLDRRSERWLPCAELPNATSGPTEWVPVMAPCMVIGINRIRGE
jgi:hypothetical protein